MENLIIAPGIKTPSINFLLESGLLEIRGKSIPENSIEFYRSIYEWIDAYILQAQPKTEVTIGLEYFNTSSSKCLLDIFRKLENLHKSGKSQVTINWLYEEEDEDMMEAGDDYQTIVKVPFVITKI